MDIRNQRQSEFSEQWLTSNRFNIMYIAPRVGKIRTTILILEKLKKNCTILVAFPDNKIKKSWKDDFKRWGYDDACVTYTTYLSLKKYKDCLYDLVVLDEIHTISEAQIVVCKELLEHNKEIVALTGTLSSWTEKVLREDLGLKVLVRYPIELAIEEDILPDYEITVVTVPLDGRIKKDYNGKFKTEKERFNNLMWVVREQEKEEKPSFMIKLKIIDLLMNSVSRLNKTKELIQKHIDERILIFCGRTEIADNLGIPSYHSKSEEKETFDNFLNGTISHLAVVKIGATGSTYLPLNRVIINHFSSSSEDLTQKLNRAMSFEYDNPQKVAKLYILCSTEEIEKSWLKRALSMFDSKKIKYV